MKRYIKCLFSGSSQQMLSFLEALAGGFCALLLELAVILLQLKSKFGCFFKKADQQERKKLNTYRYKMVILSTNIFFFQIVCINDGHWSSNATT